MAGSLVAIAKRKGGVGASTIAAALGLAYYSQRLSRSDRPMLRAQRIRRRLGSEDGMDEPAKPKGMHWQTYNRLLDQADELDDLGWIRTLGLSAV
jgi:hypothetical protein